MQNNLPEHIETKIENFIQGKLDEKELEELLRLADNDAIIREEIQVRSKLAEVVRYYGASRLKRHLQNLFNKEKSTNKHSSYNYIWIVISVLALALLIYHFMYKTNQPTLPQEIYAAYYSTYNWDFGTRSLDYEQTIQTAHEYYTAGNYSAVIQQLATLPDSLLTDELRLIQGLSYYENNEQEKSLNAFQNLYTDSASLYRDHARWYATLIQIQQNNIRQAKQLIIPLTQDPQADHHEEAKALAADLNRLEE